MSVTELTDRRERTYGSAGPNSRIGVALDPARRLRHGQRMAERWSCVRCATPVGRDAQGRWWCDHDGSVAAIDGYTEPTVHSLLQQATQVAAPTWLPWPMLDQLSLAGTAAAIDVDGQPQATLAAFSGADVVGGAADLVIVCEEPMVGLGARYAAATGLDIGSEIAHRAPAVHVSVNGRATPMWWIAGPTDRDVFVGEASGRWLWIVAWPATAGALVNDRLTLRDLRDLLGQVDLIPLTGLSPRL